MSEHGALTRWTTPDGPWTEPDLHLFPQDGHRYEIVDGCLHVTPPLDAAHEAAVGTLITALRGAAPDGWSACGRLGVEIGPSNLVPDVTVLRPRTSGAVWSHPGDVALVVEVESPSTRRFDRLLKPALYAEAGIQAYWRVEVDGPTPVIHVYGLVPGGGYLLERSIRGAAGTTVDRPFPVRIAPAGWAVRGSGVTCDRRAWPTGPVR